MKNNLAHWFSSFYLYSKDHKIISLIIGIAIIGGGYYAYTKVSAEVTPVRYVLGQTEKGTLITSISGTGQVSASNQLDVKPKVSGQITSVSVKAGQEVKAGTILAQIDSRDALQEVRDAQADLTSAKISLEKTKTSTTKSKEDAQKELTKAYEDAYSTLTDVYTSYSTIIDDVDDIFYDRAHSPYAQEDSLRAKISYSAVEERNKVGVQFDAAKREYEALFKEYEKLDRSSNQTDIEILISNTYSYSKKLTDVLKNTQTFLKYVEKRLTTIPTELTDDTATINGYVTSVNGKVSNLFSLQATIKDAKADLETANQTYAQLSGSTDPLDVQTAQLTVTQRQNAYQKTLNTLSDYTIRAAFDGVVATVPVKKGDNASSATTIATLMTKQQIATISLNEIDVAHVKAGQKATLTFDAIEDLSISGQVLEVDAIGTASQGVVSYNVKIGFDTQDERVKPGMSASASVITDSKPNVLLVPSTAVKTNANGSYVEVFDATATLTQAQGGVTSSISPKQIPVEIGAANDTQTEIISGIEEGEQIVTRTITASTQTTATTQRTGTGVLGVPTGGNVRMQTGTFGGRNFQR